jgi:AraC-like DNA-binding protein
MTVIGYIFNGVVLEVLRMNQFTCGGYWQPVPGVVPAVITAVHRCQQTGRLSSRLVQNQWVLDYSISAYGRFKAGSRSRQWVARPARIAHLYPPHTPYAEDLRREITPIWDAFMIFTAGSAPELRQLIRPPHPYASFMDPDGRIGRLLQRAAQIGQDEGQSGFWKVQSVLCSLLDHLVNSAHVSGPMYRIDPTLARPAPSPLVSAADAWLRSHLSTPGSLAALARSLNVSVSTLCHRYRAETGVAPMQSRLAMRIELAKNLLLKGHGMKIVASEAGFCDEYHLSKTFKQMTGLSPRRFRQSMLSDI